MAKRKEKKEETSSNFEAQEISLEDFEKIIKVVENSVTETKTTIERRETRKDLTPAPRVCLETKTIPPRRKKNG